MAKQSGATRTDKAAHWLFDVACTFDTGSRSYGRNCPRCGTALLTAYHEEKLYSVHCPACSIVSLVKARNPYEAEQQVGLLPNREYPGTREG